ncbi:Peroxisomal acyl-coenzyme A oxidase 3 [Halotydeus destructor]|nr:Peroxisomal acyl-coenzyme A oxidase 3 [Halotydeus destructor]
MKRLIYPDHVIIHVARHMDILAREPLFDRKPWQEPADRSEYQRLTALRMKKLNQLQFITEDSLYKQPQEANAIFHHIGMFDWSLYVKRMMAQDFFAYIARTNGSKSVQKLVSKVYDGSISGAILITELGHGSDTKRLMTTATFESKTRQFVIHTPCLKAAKVWSGNLGQLATHGVVFAQLYTEDGQHHGLHQFLLPIRNGDLLPFPGIKVGDMGPKAGLNGLDNGVLQFDHYRVPQECWLNKRATIDESGKYVAKVSSGGKAGLTLGSLSAGRIGVIVQSYLTFGEQTAELSEMGSEIHAISCAGKAVCSWLTRDGIQEAREACGGHGYLRASRFGQLRDDHDPNNTYEGDNNVLLQQTANFLVRLYDDKLTKGKKIVTQLGICDFMDDAGAILASNSFKPHLDDTKSIIQVYHYLICYLTKITHEKLSKLKDESANLFSAKAQAQVYYHRSLSIVFFECDAITRFSLFVDGCSDPSLKNVLTNLQHLFALWCLEKHFLYLFQSNFTGFNDNFNLSKLKEKILYLCNQLKNDSVSLCDAIAPPDFIINSCLGQADGNIYQNIFDAMEQNGGYDKPSWYKPELLSAKL